MGGANHIVSMPDLQSADPEQSHTGVRRRCASYRRVEDAPERRSESFSQRRSFTVGPSGG